MIFLEEENVGEKYATSAIGFTAEQDSAKQKTQLRAKKKNKGFWALDWLINMLQGPRSARSLFDSPYPPSPTSANKHIPKQAYSR